MNKIVYFIDDDEHERRSCVDVLKELFQDTSIRIEPLAPLAAIANYAQLLIEQKVAAFILDERLNATGCVFYTGSELAEHLRAIGGNLPIVILTNYPDDDFTPKEWAVEGIVAKKSVVNDPNSTAAQTFKARVCRQIEISGTLFTEREKRYHDLLVKSTTGLSAEEECQLSALEAERIAPIAASEREEQQKLDAQIANLKRLLDTQK